MVSEYKTGKDVEESVRNRFVIACRHLSGGGTKNHKNLNHHNTRQDSKQLPLQNNSIVLLYYPTGLVGIILSTLN